MGNIKHNSLHILVVEDNDDIRHIMEDMLSSCGYFVRVAENGEVGLEKLKSDDYDLMITDLGLPGISGWELSRISKRYQSNMPILAISSWQGKGAVKKIASYGICQIIWKPFRFDQIQLAIDQLCFAPAQKIKASQK